jgi:transmembrane sensor
VVETVLAEGKVLMEQNNAGLFDKAIEMAPNQLASFDRTTKKTIIKTVDTDNFILWTAGMLKFESTDLNRITKQLERYYNIRFQFSDPMLGALRISGKLELKGGKEEICERIASVASVKIVKRGDNLYEILK